MRPRDRGAVSAGVALLITLSVSACAGEVDSAPDEPVAAAPSASATPSASASMGLGPVESYQAWLLASRTPDVDAACTVLIPALQDAMITELNAGGAVQVSSCEEMIAATAELYKALGQSADVDIAVQEETTTTATLFVTYLASGDCGTVVMQRPATQWIITEQSQECAS